MRIFLKVFAFNVVVIGFFLYVGNSIPQLRQDPPEELVLAADASAEDFVKAGKSFRSGVSFSKVLRQAIKICDHPFQVL